MKFDWVVLAGSLLVVPVAGAQVRPSVDDAKTLYYSAAFDDALGILDALRAAGAGSVTVEEYRAACLLALGRDAEARDTIAALVRADPGRHATVLTASRATRPMYETTRAAVLADLVRERYVAATAALSADQPAAAAREFAAVLRLFNELPEPVSGDLADFRMLSAEFLDSLRNEARPAASADSERVYSADDAGVVPPAIVRQQVPQPPAEPDIDFSGAALLEVWISADGRVDHAALHKTIHPAYDQLILAAARDWQYTPATVDGRAVRFRKLLQIDVR